MATTEPQAESPLTDLPANWSVEGPTVTAKGSRYFVLTGIIEGRYNDRELTLIAYTAPESPLWHGKASGGRRRTRSIHTGSREGTLRALADEAERLNDEWAAIDGFEVPLQ